MLAFSALQTPNAWNVISIVMDLLLARFLHKNIAPQMVVENSGKNLNNIR